MSYHTVYPVVSHHFLRRTAEAKATKLNKQHQSHYGDSDFYYTAQKYKRNLYKYRVVKKVKDA